MKTIKIALFLLLALLINSVYSQDKVGTVTVTVDGSSFTGDLLQISTSSSYEVNAGDASKGFKIFWNNISSPAEIKTGTTKLPDDKSAVNVAYVNFANSTPAIVISGSVTTTQMDDPNKGKVVKGTFEFKALEGGIPKELGGTEHSFTNGTFEIHYDNK